MIEYESTATKSPLYQVFLCMCRVNAEFVAVFHIYTLHILLVLYVLLYDRQRSAPNS